MQGVNAGLGVGRPPARGPPSQATALGTAVWEGGLRISPRPTSSPRNAVDFFPRGNVVFKSFFFNIFY